MNSYKNKNHNKNINNIIYYNKTSSVKLGCTLIVFSLVNFENQFSVPPALFVIIIPHFLSKSLPIIKFESQIPVR